MSILENLNISCNSTTKKNELYHILKRTTQQIYSKYYKD